MYFVYFFFSQQLKLKSYISMKRPHFQKYRYTKIKSTKNITDNSLNALFCLYFAHFFFLSWLGRGLDGLPMKCPRLRHFCERGSEK